MDLSEELRNYNEKIPEYSESEEWHIEWGEAEEEEEEDIGEYLKELKDTEAIKEIETFADFISEFEARRAKELALKAEAKKKRLRHLIGIEEKKKDDEVSEETLITPEEEVVLQEETSSESSTHPCLREIDISDSQLKLFNLYTAYPVPDDPGIVPAFWNLRPRSPSYEDNGVQKFFDLAEKYKLKPIHSMREMLLTNKIDLKYYGLDPRIVKIICEALVQNTTVRTIDLQDNLLSVDACYHLNELLLKNNFIETLLLSGCKIGANGVKKLRTGISLSMVLKEFDLSRCNLRNEGFNYITTALCENLSLESLSLSNNYLDEFCAKSLENLISNSQTLKNLDLSWNSLYTIEVWKALVKGFEKNQILTSLDLSWNGLGNECVMQLRTVLQNSVLQKLKLNNNRFTEKDTKQIARALSKNETLEELYLGNNPLRSDGAVALIAAVSSQKSMSTNLRLLDLENVWAKKDVLPRLEAIENSKPWLEIRLGGILSNYKLIGPDAKKILLKRANFEAMMPKKKRERKNFGHFVLSLRDRHISKKAFKELVRKFKLKLSESLIEEIMNEFVGPKDTVDQGYLKSFYLEEYPDTQPVPPKPQKMKITKKK